MELELVLLMETSWLQSSSVFMSMSAVLEHHHLSADVGDDDRDQRIFELALPISLSHAAAATAAAIAGESVWSACDRLVIRL